MSHGLFGAGPVGDVDKCGTVCKLCRGCNSPKIPISGPKGAKVMVVVGSPGLAEDKRGRWMNDYSGVMLKGILDEYDVPWRVTGATRCRPPDDRAPLPREIDACSRSLRFDIAENRVDIVLACGTSALEAIIGDRYLKSLGGIDAWRGLLIPDPQNNVWIMPTYSPVYVLRNSVRAEGERMNPVIDVLFKRDIARAFKKVGARKPNPEIDLDGCVKILHSTKDILNEIKIMRAAKMPTAFDYETTGLKPHRPGHDIICASFCNGLGPAIAFMMKDARVRQAWCDFLRDKLVPKIAQSLKFEHVWSAVILKTIVRGWYADTQLNAHIEDNREGFTGLKFQVAVKFGVFDYNSTVAHYLKADAAEVKAHGANAFNRIRLAPELSLLKYCGLDSYFEYHLLLRQLRDVK